MESEVRKMNEIEQLRQENRELKISLEQCRRTNKMLMDFFVENMRRIREVEKFIREGGSTLSELLDPRASLKKK
jgi:hypothetical protein